MMEQEINAAVEWWVEQLRQLAHHDAGDRLNSAFVNVFTERYFTPLSDEQLATFRSALHEEVTKMVEEHPPKEGDPMWGAAMRCFGTDYGPDHVLGEAADRAHIDDQRLRFPVKTLMWVDPGKVEVRPGYGAEEQVIYSR